MEHIKCQSLTRPGNKKEQLVSTMPSNQYFFEMRVVDIKDIPTENETLKKQCRLLQKTCLQKSKANILKSVQE